ncbi:exonuclease III [compost metagenome]
MSNRGLRLDHLWTSPGLTPAVVKGSARILDTVREWERPSDHAPVVMDLDV